MTETDSRIVKELGMSVGRYAGDGVRRAVMEGSEELESSSKGEKFAEWVREAMTKLDDLVDQSTRDRIMQNCGRNCSLEYGEVIQCARERFRQRRNLDDYLNSEMRMHRQRIRLKREGDILYQVYEPRSGAKGARCFCSLLRNLPQDQSISLTYCHCSKGFVRNYWEQVFGKPVKVEILESVISGGKECRFAIYLPEGLDENRA